MKIQFTKLKKQAKGRAKNGRTEYKQFTGENTILTADLA
jgi:hypothetical protein